jgi:hypothetical protein
MCTWRLADLLYFLFFVLWRVKHNGTAILLLFAMAEINLNFIPYFSPVLDRQIFSPERSVSPQPQRQPALSHHSTTRTLPEGLQKYENLEECE